MTIDRFRWLVLAVAGAWALMLVVDLQTMRSQWSEFAAAGHPASTVWMTYAFVGGQQTLFAAMLFGLYHFRRWARVAGLILLGLMVLYAGLADYSAEAGLASALHAVGGYLMIAVLAAAYWVPAIAERFETRG